MARGHTVGQAAARVAMVLAVALATTGARAAGDDVALFTLPYARFTAVRAMPGGDVVVVGRSTGANAFHLGGTHARPVAFVARMDPRTGAVRWRHALEVGPQTVCHGPRTRLETLDADGAGDVFVGAYLAGAAATRGRTARPSGPVVLAFGPEGRRRFALHPKGPDGGTAAHVAGVAARRDRGVDVAVDGPRGPVLLRVDAAGKVTRRLALAASPLGPLPCGPFGPAPRATVDGLRRAPGGALILHGTFAHTRLRLGKHTLVAPPGPRADPGFWAMLDARDRPVALRHAPGGVTAWSPAGGARVLAVLRGARDTQVLRSFDLVAGTRGRVLRRQPAGARIHVVAVAGGRPLASLQQGGGSRVYGGVRVTPETATSPNASASVVGRLDRRGRFRAHPRVLYGRGTGRGAGTLGGVFVADLQAATGGRLVAVGAFAGRLETGGLKVPGVLRSRPCPPEPAGHEHPVAPGCTETVPADTAFLAVWSGRVPARSPR